MYGGGGLRCTGGGGLLITTPCCKCIENIPSYQSKYNSVAVQNG